MQLDRTWQHPVSSETISSNWPIGWIPCWGYLGIFIKKHLYIKGILVLILIDINRKAVQISFQHKELSSYYNTQIFLSVTSNKQTYMIIYTFNIKTITTQTSTTFNIITSRPQTPTTFTIKTIKPQTSTTFNINTITTQTSTSFNIKTITPQTPTTFNIKTSRPQTPTTFYIKTIQLKHQLHSISKQFYLKHQLHSISKQYNSNTNYIQ
mgnify:CR=1 FL=1